MQSPLTKDQEVVLLAVAQNPRALTYLDLARRLGDGYSKVNVHRIVTRLERRGLIRRSRYGHRSLEAVRLLGG